MLATYCDHDGLRAETPPDTTVALYDACSALGIALGDCAPGPTGGGAVKLTLTPEALDGRQFTSAVLHRQNGTREELPLSRNGEDLTLETRLDRWEAAVIEIR
jgi:hypothetical protein